MLVAGLALVAYFRLRQIRSGMAALSQEICVHRGAEFGAALPALCVCGALSLRRADGRAERHRPDVGALLTVLLLGARPACSRLSLLCGAVACLLYFRLIVDIGPAGALTVTYLIPLFGVLWGTLFLGEALCP